MFYLLLTAHAALSIGTNGGEVLAAAGVQLFGDMDSASGLEIPLAVSPPVIDRYLSLNPFVRLRDLPGTLKIRLFRNEVFVRFYAGRLHTAFFFWY
jgi:hypothetical protein